MGLGATHAYSFTNSKINQINHHENMKKYIIKTNTQTSRKNDYFILVRS